MSNKFIYNIDEIESIDSISDDDNDVDLWVPINNNKNNFENKENNFIDISQLNKKIQKKENHKKILCLNMLTKGTCKYGAKCLYAHDLTEQKMDEVRSKSYNMIKNSSDLTNINIFNEKDLYKSLLTLSNLCIGCNDNKCTGGYNCKYGAVCHECVVCSKDLNNGSCHDPNCKKCHLTNKGLKPYFNYVLEAQNNKKRNNQEMIGILLNQDFFNKLEIEELEDNSELDKETNRFDISIFKCNIFECV